VELPQSPLKILRILPWRKDIAAVKTEDHMAPGKYLHEERKNDLLAFIVHPETVHCGVRHLPKNPPVSW
jgi:hypothetical protein